MMNSQGQGRDNKFQGRGRGRGRRRPKPEFDQELVDVARVARMQAGGRRFRFRVTMVIGDKKGRVGLGVAKGADVTSAVSKAVEAAKKKMIQVKLVDKRTIPHQIEVKKGSARVLLKPAGKGRGIIAGSSVRSVLELAGVRDVYGKIQGTNNKLSNVLATLEALERMRTYEEVMRSRGKEISKKANSESKPKDQKKEISKAEVGKK